MYQIASGKGSLSCCAERSTQAVGSLGRHVARSKGGHPLHSTVPWPAEDVAFISNSTTLRTPRSSPWAEALEEFSGTSNTRHPCPSRDTAGHVLPQQLCAVLTSDQGTCMLSWLFPNLSGAPKVPFLPQVPVSTLQAARARTTLCLVPIAAVLLVLIIKLRLYKKKEWASWDRSSHALFLLPAFLL